MSNTQEKSKCCGANKLADYDLEFNEFFRCATCGKPFIPQEKEVINCKECGHENPKKFMGKEYISHAPGCSQERVDSTESWGREEFYNKNGIFFDLDSNIELANRVYTLAVKQEREKWVSELQALEEMAESLKEDIDIQKEDPIVIALKFKHNQTLRSLLFLIKKLKEKYHNSVKIK